MKPEKPGFSVLAHSLRVDVWLTVIGVFASRGLASDFPLSFLWDGGSD